MSEPLTPEEIAELATYQADPKRTEAARKAGLASAAKPNRGRFVQGDPRASECAKRSSGRFVRGSARASACARVSNAQKEGT